VSDLRYTLLSDGSSDRALLPILTWLLGQCGMRGTIIPTWADLGLLALPPKGLTARIEVSLQLYPCSLLFVHRDAESVSRESRVAEIERAARSLPPAVLALPTVAVAPVRMTEAWLLFDEHAIRTAAENPRGRQRIALPPVSRLEREFDPKATLHAALRNASGRRGRRLQQFSAEASAQSLSTLVTDFSPLRALPAFASLERYIAAAVTANGWDSG